MKEFYHPSKLRSVLCDFASNFCPTDHEFNDEFHDKEGDELDDENNFVILGDMMLTPQQNELLFSNDNTKRHGLIRSFDHWPNAVVPIRILNDKFPANFVQVIRDAASYIENVSCVKFDFRDDPVDNFLTVMPGGGCSSSVGNLRQGEQFLLLSSAKCKKGKINR